MFGGSFDVENDLALSRSAQNRNIEQDSRKQNHRELGTHREEV
jgi:hypothetical protein